MIQLEKGLLSYRALFYYGLNNISSMRSLRFTALVLVAAIILLLIAGCTQPAGSGTPATTTAPAEAGATVGILYSKGVGPMPMLLATKQIDGYIAWQPFVSIGSESKLGKVVAYSGNLPPIASNANHPCCILFASDSLIAQNPGIVSSVSALTQLSSKYIIDHPEEASQLDAAFLVGGSNFTYGNVTVPSVDVLEDAFPTVKYTNEPTPAWVNATKQFVNTQIQLGYVTNQLKTSDSARLDAQLFNFAPYQSAKAMVAGNSFRTPAKMIEPITIGYLNGDMHSAALHIALKKWQYFNNTYGIALKPRDATMARPDMADLIVNGVPVAEVRLVGGDAGPQVMQMAATDIVQMGYLGVPPAIAAIDKGTPIKIINPVNTEGSGLIVDPNAPVTDWKSFVAWAQQRSAAGNPLKIAAPGKGSIQDVLLQFALKDSGLSFKESS
ncbi:MAG: sulfonate transport system substrate-binding protein [Methanoregula sp. SKADARSKE-2]|nr:MAG: sulfonate transport system substrate-binding protein [Methanoregula sp. SKADARSKE-2]